MIEEIRKIDTLLSEYDFDTAIEIFTSKEFEKF